MDDNYLQPNRTATEWERKYSTAYLLCLIFRNVPIIVSVVQSKPNNYLVFSQDALNQPDQPEHKVQSLLLQVQAGRISSQYQEAHRELLEVDAAVLRGNIFRFFD